MTRVLLNFNSQRLSATVCKERDRLPSKQLDKARKTVSISVVQDAVSVEAVRRGGIHVAASGLR
jgi:hypothetical protein